RRGAFHAARHSTEPGKRRRSFSRKSLPVPTPPPGTRAREPAAIARHGIGSGASRLVTGNPPLFAELERRLARLKGSQAACVFGSGYLANAGIIPALIGPADLVLIDELSHACLWTGA